MPDSRVVPAIIGYVLFTFAGYLAIGSALAILPVFISHQLGFSTVTAGIVISLQYLSTFVFRAYAGTIVDQRGPRPAVMMSMSAFLLSGILLYASWLCKGLPVLSLALLALTRLLTGLGEGMIGASPINWAILSVGDAHMAKAISYNGVASYGALAIGAPLGVILNQLLGMGSVSLLIGLLGIAGFLYARSKTNRVATARARKAPFFKVFRMVAPYGCCLALGGLGFGAISTFITLYYASVHWENAVVCLSVFSMAFVVTRILFGSAIDQYGGMKTAIVCLSVEAVGLLLLWQADTPLVAVIGAGIAGMGFSLTFPALGVVAVSRVPASVQGTALGGYGLFLDLSLGITGPLIGLIAGHFGMRQIYLFAALVVFAGWVMTVLLAYRGGVEQKMKDGKS